MRKDSDSEEESLISENLRRQKNDPSSQLHFSQSQRGPSVFSKWSSGKVGQTHRKGTIPSTSSSSVSRTSTGHNARVEAAFTEVGLSSPEQPVMLSLASKRRSSSEKEKHGSKTITSVLSAGSGIETVSETDFSSDMENEETSILPAKNLFSPAGRTSGGIASGNSLSTSVLTASSTKSCLMANSSSLAVSKVSARYSDLLVTKTLLSSDSSNDDDVGVDDLEPSASKCNASSVTLDKSVGFLQQPVFCQSGAADDTQELFDLPKLNVPAKRNWTDEQSATASSSSHAVLNATTIIKNGINIHSACESGRLLQSYESSSDADIDSLSSDFEDEDEKFDGDEKFVKESHSLKAVAKNHEMSLKMTANVFKHFVLYEDVSTPSVLTEESQDSLTIRKTVDPVAEQFCDKIDDISNKADSSLPNQSCIPAVGHHVPTSASELTSSDSARLNLIKSAPNPTYEPLSDDEDTQPPLDFHSVDTIPISEHFQKQNDLYPPPLERISCTQEHSDFSQPPFLQKIESEPSPLSQKFKSGKLTGCTVSTEVSGSVRCFDDSSSSCQPLPSVKSGQLTGCTVSTEVSGSVGCTNNPPSPCQPLPSVKKEKGESESITQQKCLIPPFMGEEQKLASAGGALASTNDAVLPFALDPLIASLLSANPGQDLNVQLPTKVGDRDIIIPVPLSTLLTALTNQQFIGSVSQSWVSHMLPALIKVEKEQVKVKSEKDPSCCDQLPYVFSTSAEAPIEIDDSDDHDDVNSQNLFDVSNGSCQGQDSEDPPKPLILASVRDGGQDAVSYTVEEDCVIVFDSDDEEIFSQFTQVEVKKEMNDEDDNSSVWFSDKQCLLEPSTNNFDESDNSDFDDEKMCFVEGDDFEILSKLDNNDDMDSDEEKTQIDALSKFEHRETQLVRPKVQLISSYCDGASKSVFSEQTIIDEAGSLSENENLVFNETQIDDTSANKVSKCDKEVLPEEGKTTGVEGKQSSNDLLEDGMDQYLFEAATQIDSEASVPRAAALDSSSQNVHISGTQGMHLSQLQTSVSRNPTVLVDPDRTKEQSSSKSSTESQAQQMVHMSATALEGLGKLEAAENPMEMSDNDEQAVSDLDDDFFGSDTQIDQDIDIDHKEDSVYDGATQVDGHTKKKHVCEDLRETFISENRSCGHDAAFECLTQVDSHILGGKSKHLKSNSLFDNATIEDDLHSSKDIDKEAKLCSEKIEDIFASATQHDKDPYAVPTQSDLCQVLDDSQDVGPSRPVNNYENVSSGTPEIYSEDESDSSSDPISFLRSPAEKEIERILSSDAFVCLSTEEEEKGLDLDKSNRVIHTISSSSSKDTSEDQSKNFFTKLGASKTIEDAKSAMKRLKEKNLKHKVIEISPQAAKPRRGKILGLKQKLCSATIESAQQSGLKNKRKSTEGVTEVTPPKKALSGVKSPEFSALSKTCGWLGKTSALNSVIMAKPAKSPTKRRRSKHTDPVGTPMAEALSRAKQAMEARRLRALKDPSQATPHAGRHSGATHTAGAAEFDTDVEMPNTQEVFTKGLPLLTYCATVSKRRLQGWSSDQKTPTGSLSSELAVDVNSSEPRLLPGKCDDKSSQNSTAGKKYLKSPSSETMRPSSEDSRETDQSTAENISSSKKGKILTIKCSNKTVCKDRLYKKSSKDSSERNLPSSRNRSESSDSSSAKALASDGKSTSSKLEEKVGAVCRNKFIRSLSRPEGTDQHKIALDAADKSTSSSSKQAKDKDRLSHTGKHSSCTHSVEKGDTRGRHASSMPDSKTSGMHLLAKSTPPKLVSQTSHSSESSKLLHGQSSHSSQESSKLHHRQLSQSSKLHQGQSSQSSESSKLQHGKSSHSSESSKLHHGEKIEEVSRQSSFSKKEKDRRSSKDSNAECTSSHDTKQSKTDCHHHNDLKCSSLILKTTEFEASPERNIFTVFQSVSEVGKCGLSPTESIPKMESQDSRRRRQSDSSLTDTFTTLNIQLANFASTGSTSKHIQSTNKIDNDAKSQSSNKVEKNKIDQTKKRKHCDSKDEPITRKKQCDLSHAKMNRERSSSLDNNTKVCLGTSKSSDKVQITVNSSSLQSIICKEQPSSDSKSDNSCNSETRNSLQQAGIGSNRSSQPSLLQADKNKSIMTEKDVTPIQKLENNINKSLISKSSNVQQPDRPKIVLKDHPKGPDNDTANRSKSTESQFRLKSVRFNLASENQTRPLPQATSTSTTVGRLNQSTVESLPSRRPSHEINPAGNLLEKGLQSTGPVWKPLVEKSITVAQPSTSHGKVPSGRLLEINDLVHRVVRWSYIWLSEYEKQVERAEVNKKPSATVTLPPIVDSSKLCPLLTSYGEIVEYQQICLQLLLLEVWEEIFRNWKVKQAKPVAPFQACLIKTIFSHEDTNKEYVTFCYMGLLTEDAVRKHKNLGENDVVILKLKGRYLPGCNNHATTSGALVDLTQLGVVTRLSLDKLYNPDAVKKFKATYPKLDKHPVWNSQSRGLFSVRIEVKTCYKKFAPLADLINIDLLTSLTAAMRRFAALQMLPRSPMMADILRPSLEASSHPDNFIKDDKAKDKCLNSSQHLAVKSMVVAARQPVSKPRIILLQGPPGTGKSHVIIASLIKIWARNKKAKICLATPSNAAADELMRRLIKHIREQHIESFSVVRIGNSDNMHSDVRHHFIDFKVMKAKEKALHMKKVSRLPLVAQKEDEFLASLINKKLTELQQAKDDPAKVKEFEMELSRLQKRRAGIVKGMMDKDIFLTPQEQNEIYIQELKQPTVVCGTLSSFGHPKIINAFCRNENRRNNNHFTCAVIDEATQATELDSLIPLQYNMTKLFLVGDPNQLPPTVLSMKAQGLNYGLSLFERLYNYYSDCMNGKPVLMLKVQYRMDKEICRYPSHSFYGGKLSTDKSVIENCSHYPLRPYILFDVEDGQELLSQTGSLCNKLEAEITVTLCRMLINKESNICAKNIGIICAYIKQKKLITDMLHRWNLEQVEVNTVDGFQGREKHIIILSCVRARSSTGTIGFMADTRRMNVALTRAKYALYIVCNVQSFESNSDWLKLIEDAKKRKMGGFSVMQRITSLSDLPNVIVQRCVKSRFQARFLAGIQSRTDSATKSDQQHS